MDRSSRERSAQSNLSPVTNWPLQCLKALKEARCNEGSAALPEQDEKSYAAGLEKIDGALFNTHRNVTLDLVAVVKNKALSDSTRAIAIALLSRLAEFDCNILAAQISRAESRQAERAEAPPLPSPYSIRVAKPHTQAILNLLDDRSESKELRAAARRALEFLKRRQPSNS